MSLFKKDHIKCLIQSMASDETIDRNSNFYLFLYLQGPHHHHSIRTPHSQLDSYDHNTSVREEKHYPHYIDGMLRHSIDCDSLQVTTRDTVAEPGIESTSFRSKYSVLPLDYPSSPTLIIFLVRIPHVQ